MEQVRKLETLRQNFTRDKRRRSFKTRFHPLLDRSSSYGSLSSISAVGSVPADVVREIVDLLSPGDILNFSLTVRVSFTSFKHTNSNPRVVETS
jgi:hypothetical protein